ncbi:MAG: hypothetical protein SFX72_04080 [Isosphaeraceae bacterium]|nr:hypothetical protein [Isosphaeraceae bacterium]
MESPVDDATFDALDEVLRDSGAAAAIAKLGAELSTRGAHRPLLDALLLQARHELGLPPVAPASLLSIDEPLRSKYEERYVEAIRVVGGKLLAEGDIAGAWPYFRAISEKEPVAAAIEAYRPAPEGDERLGSIVEVAFNQGVNPIAGFRLILEHYGACSSITAFEGLPPEESVRSTCADLLTRHLHANLLENIRADIERRGQPMPPETASIADHLAGRDWLFQDDAYHIDVSHLMSVVRYSPLLTDPETIAAAVGLTDYGRRLSDRHRYEGEPPFENVYEDHAFYLRALLGRHVDEAVAHFRAKLEGLDERGRAEVAQVLVRLLHRVGRRAEALETAVEHLAGYPESMLSCPGVPSLAVELGKPDRLADAARASGDLVNYLAARIAAAAK